MPSTFVSRLSTSVIWLYRLLFLPALLLASPYFVWRMRRRGGYRHGFWHRFGEVPALPAKRPGVRRIWLQAVSVGEMLAIAPLLKALRCDTSVEVYLTTTTSTGYKLARERYPDLTVGIGYFPLDFWAFSARTWQQVQPDLAVLMEGERWPEHIRQAARRGVPVLCVNARMSDRSWRRVKRVRWLLPALYRHIAALAAATETDAQRFLALGFPAARLTTTGNLKLDVTIATLDDGAIGQLRRELGLPASGMVLFGSSTWAGEEAALVQALRAARAHGLHVSLVLVPRHAERREELRAMLARSDLRFHLRSLGAAPAEVDVAVGDTTGELAKLTQLADLVFVGKSLAPHDGGQTPVEAAILGKPVLHGPRMTNFREIVRTLDAAGATRTVDNHSELVAKAVELLQDPAQREAMAAAAREWTEVNRGATARTLAVIRTALAHAAPVRS